jgi:glutamine---fructose-6-phosphate transaminase (isomerizing)
MKEVSYVHAQGYAAGELKHGPIALVQDRMPVIALVPRDQTYDKMCSNVSEVCSRGACLVAITTADENRLGAAAEMTVQVPQTLPWLQPLLTALPLQLIAYHVGVLRGCDVDKPRNLAKSVTVE